MVNVRKRVYLAKFGCLTNLTMTSNSRPLKRIFVKLAMSFLLHYFHNYQKEWSNLASSLSSKSLNELKCTVPDRTTLSHGYPTATRNSIFLLESRSFHEIFVAVSLLLSRLHLRVRFEPSIGRDWTKRRCPKE